MHCSSVVADIHSSRGEWILFLCKCTHAGPRQIDVYTDEPFLSMNLKNQDITPCILLSLCTNGLSTYLHAWRPPIHLHVVMSSCQTLPVIVKDPTLGSSLNQCIWDKTSASVRSFTAAIFTPFSFILLQKQQNWHSLYPPHLLSV